MSDASPRPWRMFLPLGLVLLLILLWSGYWFVASGIAKTRFAAERATLAAQGWHLACTEETWAGYPFHFEFTCRSPVLTFLDKAEVRSGSLLLVALAYAPWQVAALLDGPTTLSASQLPPTRVEHERALAAVTFGKDTQPSVSAEIPNASAAGLGRADKLMMHTRPSTAGGTDLALIGNGVRYEPPGKPSVTADEGKLLGTLKDGPTVDVTSFELRTGDLRYWGSGSVGLDQNHRPAGQAATETNDIGALLALLSPHLGLPASQLGNLRTMLSLLGSDAKVPVIAKDGILYVGPFKITELKPLY